MKCSEMKLGQVYVCKDCGLELKVVRACDCEGESCSCADLKCCGEGMKLKA
jgi:hypothetical protein